MSRENVEVVKQWIAAYNSRDFETLVRIQDPDFEFRSIFVSIESVFHGPEGFPYEYFREIEEAYDRIEVVADRYIDVGAGVLLEGKIEWEGRSGTAGATPVVGVFWLRAGKVFREETFADRAEGFAAAGLSEVDSKSNVQVSRELVEAVAQRDLDRLIEGTDSGVEWHSFFAQLGEGGEYRGHDGIRRYMSDLDDAWDLWRFYEDGALAVDDLVLMVGHFQYRGRDSGVETTIPGGFLIKFQNGKAVFMRSWRDPAHALEAVARQE